MNHFQVKCSTMCHSIWIMGGLLIEMHADEGDNENCATRHLRKPLIQIPLPNCKILFDLK